MTDCAYSDPPRAGEDRRISGIYEARNASWSLVTPVRLDPYSALVRQSYRLRPEFDHLLTTNPSAWQDRGNRPDPRGSNPVQLTGMLTRFEDCRGAVHIPPVVDGRLQAGWKDPCDGLGRDRIQLSNGTLCYGWPTVVLDGENEREIVANSEHPEVLLHKIIEQRSRVVLAGQQDPKRCSPMLLWATSAP